MKKTASIIVLVIVKNNILGHQHKELFVLTGLLSPRYNLCGINLAQHAVEVVHFYSGCADGGPVGGGWLRFEYLCLIY